MGNYKTVISFIAGVASGAGITYILMRSYTEKKINQEIDTFKKEYSSKRNIVPVASIDIPDWIREVRDEVIKDIQNEESANVNASYDTSDKESNVINYTSFFEEDEDVSLEDAVAMVEEVHLSEPTTEPIKEISFDDFERNEIFTKSTLTIFKDGFVGDINDNLITNIDDTIGQDLLDRFISSTDEDMFVMNSDLRMCYELVKSEYTFEEFTGTRPIVVNASD